MTSVSERSANKMKKEIVLLTLLSGIGGFLFGYDTGKARVKYSLGQTRKLITLQVEVESFPMSSEL